MLFRAIIFSFLLLAGTGTAVQTAQTSTEAAVLAYTYERVLIDGVWWIYVYEEDGTFVNCYPE